MKSKLFGLIFLCLSICFISSAQQKTVSLSGKLLNFSNQVQVEDLSEFQYLDLPSADMIIIPDSAGKFEISFKLSAPNYFRVGRNILYLSPGDKLSVMIDKNDATKSTFSGIGQAANSYLVNTPFPKAGSFLEAGKNLKPVPKETLETILASAAARKQNLDALTQVSPEFKRLEEARIKADVLNSINAVNTYGNISKKITDHDAYIKTFSQLSDSTKNKYSVDFIDASFMKLVVYRDVAEDLVKNVPVNADVQKINDWYRASTLVGKMSRESDKTKLKGYYTSIDSIKSPAYRASVKENLKGLLQFGKGDQAVDFTAVDINGKKVALNNLKGKVIYVDLWATWCGPCLAEMPKLDEIKNKYHDNPNVVFLSVSIDEDNHVDKWKQNVAERKAAGYQWQINRNKLSAYNVTTIPRTLLIDKRFKIVSMSAPLPSSKDLSAAIDKLLTN